MVNMREVTAFSMRLLHHCSHLIVIWCFFLLATLVTYARKYCYNEIGLWWKIYTTLDDSSCTLITHINKMIRLTRGETIIMRTYVCSTQAIYIQYLPLNQRALVYYWIEAFRWRSMLIFNFLFSAYSRCI